MLLAWCRANDAVMQKDRSISEFGGAAWVVGDDDQGRSFTVCFGVSFLASESAKLFGESFG